MRYDVNDRMRLDAKGRTDLWPFMRLMKQQRHARMHHAPIDYARSVMGRRHKKKGAKR